VLKKDPVMTLRFLLLAMLLFPGIGLSALRVDVTSGVSGAIPIAIVPFEGGQGLPVDIAAVIEQDLASTGQFRALPRADMLERPASAGVQSKSTISWWAACRPRPTAA
jgi:TolB protein